MRYFRVRNWGRFQHYAKRAPIWIKLYTNMIEDQKGDWAGWSDVQRGQIVGIWQLAAKTGNCMPFDNDFVFEEIMATEPVDLDAFKGHFEVYESKRACLASNSARDSMVRSSSPSPSLSSSLPSERKVNFAKDLLARHGMEVPRSITGEKCDKIIDDLKDKPVHIKPKKIPEAPDPPMTFEEKEASLKALREVKDG